jgi:hypothetical protein
MKPITRYVGLDVHKSTISVAVAEEGRGGEPPTGAIASGARLTDSGEATRSVGYVMPSRALTSRDITPEHVRVLDTVPVRTLQGGLGLVRAQTKGREVQRA